MRKKKWQIPLKLSQKVKELNHTLQTIQAKINEVDVYLYTLQKECETNFD